MNIKENEKSFVLKKNEKNVSALDLRTCVYLGPTICAQWKLDLFVIHDWCTFRADFENTLILF